MRPGVLEAGAGARHGLQPVRFDLPATDLAGAVGAVVDLAEGGVEVADLGLELLEDREVLLPLEGLGSDVALMLIERGELGDGAGLGLGSDPGLGLAVADEPREALTLASDQLPCLFRIHGREGTPARRARLTAPACPAG